MSSFKEAFENAVIEPETTETVDDTPVVVEPVETSPNVTPPVFDEAVAVDEDNLWALQVAKVCHAAVREFSIVVDDNTQNPIWDKLSDSLKNSSIDGVLFHTNNPEAGPSQSHQNWMDYKTKNGWSYGEEKDEEKKTHPSMVPFNELSTSEQTKDKLFCGIVKAMKQ